MKKIISMLMGIAMASSMFVATVHADASYCSFEADKTGEIQVGDTVTFTVTSKEKNVSGDIMSVIFDTDAWECTKVTNASGKRTFKYPAYNYAANPEEEDVEVELSYGGSTVTNANNSGKASLSFLDAGGLSYVMEEVDVLKVVLTAKEVTEDTNTTVTLYEELDGGEVVSFEDGTVYPATSHVGNVDSIDFTIKAPVVEDEPTWNEAADAWVTKNPDKKAIWWEFKFADGSFGGHQFITVTDGADAPTTKTVGVGAAEDYKIDGDVEFAVAVIFDEAPTDEELAKFDAYVGR